MFEDPFAVRDVVVAVREVLDNVLIHADWDRAPAPSLLVRCRVHRGLPQVCVASTNVVRYGEVRCALHFIKAHVSDKPAPRLDHESTARVTRSGYAGEPPPRASSAGLRR